MNATTAYRVRAHNVASTSEDDEAVLVQLETNHYFALNQSATLVWNALAESGGATLESLLRLPPFAGAEEARRDLTALLQELESESLIEPIGEGQLSASSAASSERADFSYLPPMMEKYERLDQLILSGE